MPDQNAKNRQLQNCLCINYQSLFFVGLFAQHQSHTYTAFKKGLPVNRFAIVFN